MEAEELQQGDIAQPLAETDAPLEEPTIEESTPAQETPSKSHGSNASDALLEATPAGITSEETIR